MWADAGVSIGLDLVKAGMSYSAAKTEAKNKRLWQDYNNKMVRLQNAMNQNSLTTNENMMKERSAEQEFSIRTSEYSTEATVEANAAATGTTGRSVNMAIFDVERNAARASQRRAQDLDYQYLGIDQQRQSSEMQAAMAQNYNFIPDPNPATYMLGFASSAMQSYSKFK